MRLPPSADPPRQALRTDWKTLPMPSTHECAVLRRAYSPEEFARLQAGIVPGQMEDKWFVFYEDPWLHLHRSWTGFCIYQVRLELRDGGVEATDVIVNRDPSQHTGSFNAALLGDLLDMAAGVPRRCYPSHQIRGCRVQPRPPEILSIDVPRVAGDASATARTPAGSLKPRPRTSAMR